LVDSLLLVAAVLIKRDVARAVRGEQKKDDACELPVLAAARVARGDKELMMGGIMLLQDRFMMY
jgi:hypothetical protein